MDKKTADGERNFRIRLEGVGLGENQWLGIYGLIPRVFAFDCVDVVEVCNAMNKLFSGILFTPDKVE